MSFNKSHEVLRPFFFWRVDVVTTINYVVLSKEDAICGLVKAGQSLYKQGLPPNNQATHYVQSLNG